MKKIYLIGSLRNPAIPRLSLALRDRGFDVFDDWYGAGPEADDKWKEYEQARGRSYQEALYGHAATHIWHFDKHHLESSDFGVLVLPAGKSGHIELGYMAGQGKPTYVLLEDGQDERWNVMYRFATALCSNVDELLDRIVREETEG